MKTKGKAREAAVIRKAGCWEKPTCFRVIVDWKTQWNCLLSLGSNDCNNLGESQRKGNVSAKEIGGRGGVYLPEVNYGLLFILELC